MPITTEVPSPASASTGTTANEAALTSSAESAKPFAADIPGEHLSDDVTKQLVALVWGASGPNRENLKRWSQGFYFSSAEPTALVQLSGGPCAVIAPVQAYLLKNAIYKQYHHAADAWREQNGQEMLIAAMLDIFRLLPCHEFYLILPCASVQIPSKRNATSMTAEADVLEESPDSPCGYSFHGDLRYAKLAFAELEKFLQDHPTLFHSSYGVLRFLYSAILSKTIDLVKEDLEDQTESLIDGTHGHGNQSLINFLLTGSAVANVWDKEKDFGELKLRGIPKRTAVGFLSLLENMRYVEVGSYYKCPELPIWLLGSETHLSILFTLVPSLVSSEAEESDAMRAFKQYDEHGSGFVAVDNLKDILAALNLFQEEDYVSSLKTKLDKEQLGIILRSDFLSEFFPGNNKFNNGRPFDVFHYNGLARNDLPVRYHHGQAKILEIGLDLEILDITNADVDSDSSVVRCLRTKYPRVEIVWDDKKIPSIN